MENYQTLISKATGVDNAKDIAEIEDYMRHTVFHSTLDWLTPKEFNKGARTAWKDIQFMRSPEGQKYLSSLIEA